MGVDLSLGKSLVLILSSFTFVILLILSRHFAQILKELIVKKQLAEAIKREKVDRIKIPIALVLFLLFIDVLMFVFNCRSDAFMINNTVLITIVFLILSYLLGFFRSIWEKKWEEIEEKADKIFMIKYIVNFIRAALFIVSGSICLMLWGLIVSDVARDFFAIIKNNKYLTAILIFIIFLVLARTVLYLFKTYLKNIVRQIETPYDNLIISKIEYPVSWIIIFVGVMISLKELGLNDSIMIPIVNTAIIIMIMHTVNVLIDNIIDYWERKVHRHHKDKVDESIFTIAHNSSKILLVIVAILFILNAWGLAQELKGVLLSLSVMGVVLGFALRETFSNIIAGISLMLDHAFKTDDVIELETGETGFVTKIGLRSTKVKTFDNEILTVPNTVLGNTKVKNYAQPNNVIRIVIPVSVEYGSDPDKVDKVLRKVVDGEEFVSNPDKTDVWFLEMAEYALKFKLVFFISDYKKRFKVKSDVTNRIYKALAKNKLNVPFPSRTLYTGKAKSYKRDVKKKVVKKKTVKKNKTAKKVVKKK